MYTTSLDQGLSKHQEVSSTPVTKVTKFIVVVLGLLWCNTKLDPER